jgi:ATP-binding cassette, subfamily C, bacterial exporter for protease/lipase
MQRQKTNGPAPSPVAVAFKNVRGGFWTAGVLSGVINILMLTGPLFMLQVYDRVLSSQSVPTLLTLLGLVLGLYAMMAAYDFLRARILSRISHRIDGSLAHPVFQQWINYQGGAQAAGYKPISDLSNVRGLLASPVFIALFDLPWFPIYLAVVFMLHFDLGVLATFGAIVVGLIAVLNEWMTGKGAQRAAQLEVAEARFSDDAHRNADSIVAMGMVGGTASAWRSLRDQSLVAMQGVSERAELLTSISKVFRLFLQSAILALGAYLAIKQEITGGAIVAASILAGRALAPIDQFIGGWKQLKRARLAHQRLGEFMSNSAAAGPQAVVELPPPTGRLSLENVSKLVPNALSRRESRPILSGLNVVLEPGDGLGVIGPSASGKSTLAKLLVGLWGPDQGAVRIDGATFEQWGAEKIGPHIGYLPQSVDLISGSIAQNICRFAADAKDQDIVEAAKLADVHQMILGFPDGYGTAVDAGIGPLTGGQRQRIALARAIYRKPRLIVLDEPNSNLDADGDAALASAIIKLRQDGCVVVVMAHRPSAIAAVDKIMMLKDGQCLEFGEKTEVLRKTTRAA